MFDKILNILNVRSIIAFALVGVFCYLAVVGSISAEQFMSVFTMIIGFFYARENASGANG